MRRLVNTGRIEHAHTDTTARTRNMVVDHVAGNPNVAGKTMGGAHDPVWDLHSANPDGLEHSLQHDFARE
jgi:hypothetical protein